MHYPAPLLQFLLFGIATASYRCIDFDVPMSFEAPSLTPEFPEFQNEIETVQFLNDISVRNAASGPPPLGAPVNISVDVTVATKYCYPRGNKSCAVQVLTHGIGFDSSYWDFGGPTSEYNYIKAATEAGYATLSYDRIGTGKSTKTNPYTTQQIGVETVVLATLTTLLREGGLSKVAKSHIPIPSKVAHIGHSFGSAITNALVAKIPSLSDAAVLTGFSTVSQYAIEFAISSNFHIAAEADPARFGHLDNGYLTWGDALSNQYSFFYAPAFEPAVLYEAEATKWPFAVSEPLVAAAIEAPNFDGPLLLIAGDADRIYCGGNCSGILPKGGSYYPKAKPFEAYIQPETGHGMNLHLNATGTYRVINDFLISNVGV